MRIDWSKVPSGTPVKEMGCDKPYLFIRYEGGSVVVRDARGRAFFLAPEEAILYSIADIKKYAVPDIKETARRIVDRAADSLDEDEAGERLIDEMIGTLHNVDEIARAFLEGKTVFYRRRGPGQIASWVKARGHHVPDTRTYQYRVQNYRAGMKADRISIDDADCVSMNDEEKAIIADTHRGFYRKYHITKADGSPTDPKADYFVLRLDEDNPWGHACREAVLGLARNLRNEFPQLASDLLTRYGEKSADAMVIKGPVRDAHFDGLEVSIARERIKAGECDKEVLERYEKIWMGDEKVTPLNLCIAEQVIQKGFCDGVVVPRFLRLMNEGRIETRSSLEPDAPWVTLDIGYYGVRPAIRIKDQNADPTPRYRPYDPAKDLICLPKFCEAQIHTESDGELAVIEAVNTHGVVARFYDGDGNHRTTAHITWEALAQWWRGEDNEPFGVKL